MEQVVLRGEGLTKDYPTARGRAEVHALRGVSIEVAEGTTLGVVGESGCGKSTLARLLVGLEAPSGGRAQVLGHDLTASRRPREVARMIQLVFQDPFSSLDPRQRVADALREVLTVHHLHQDRADDRIEELLDMVALGSRFADRFPHELSGGQAQRVAIARALAAEPRVLVLDEPTSALDVSVRAEIINLLVEVQRRLQLAYLFISHDLSMVRHVSDRIAVMYLGQVVESGGWREVLDQAAHPYTRALADAVPQPDPRHEARRRAERVERPISIGVVERGCDYQDRCPLVEERCRVEAPALSEWRAGHEVACHVALRRRVENS